MQASELVRGADWAITSEGLAQILAIAERRNEVTPEALEAYRAEHVPTAERLQMRDGVAILSVSGPLFRHANLFTSVSGATSYDVLRRDFQSAVDEAEARAILLNFDTPGGDANGVNEMAKAIRDARGRKPIVAYVGGMAASAGYWMASQADRIVIDETASLGSIGVRAAFPSAKEDGSVEFISSQSPGKRFDPVSDEGRARIQARIDAMADVFIASVAAGRNVSSQDVIERFGAGDVLVGKAAVAAGMADGFGTFESVLAELTGSLSAQNETAGILAGKRATAFETGRLAERGRLRAIIDAPEAAGRAELAQHLAFQTNMPPADAMNILRTAPTQVRQLVQEEKFIPINRADDAPGGLVLAGGQEMGATSTAASRQTDPQAGLVQAYGGSGHPFDDRSTSVMANAVKALGKQG